MALSKAFEAFAVELFEGLGEVRSKRMFGGACLYAGEALFAVADDEQIWIKIDAENEPAFLAEGSALISFQNKAGETMTMPYRRLPDAALDDPDEAARWGRSGVEAALRKKAASRPRKRKPTTAA